MPLCVYVLLLPVCSWSIRLCYSFYLVISDYLIPLSFLLAFRLTLLADIYSNVVFSWPAGWIFVVFCYNLYFSRILLRYILVYLDLYPFPFLFYRVSYILCILRVFDLFFWLLAVLCFIELRFWDFSDSVLRLFVWLSSVNFWLATFLSLLSTFCLSVLF